MQNLNSAADSPENPNHHRTLFEDIAFLSMCGILTIVLVFAMGMLICFIPGIVAGRSR